MELTLSITLNDGDDLELVGELVALLGRHEKSETVKTRPAAAPSRLDVERMIREWWLDPINAKSSVYGEADWRKLEAYEQAIVLHARLPASIWKTMRAAAELFPPNKTWTAADLAERGGLDLDDVRQRLRNIPRSRAVREYVDEVIGRLRFDPDDRDLYEAVKSAALQFASESDGRVVHYKFTPELAEELLVRSDIDRMYGPGVDGEPTVDEADQL